MKILEWLGADWKTFGIVALVGVLGVLGLKWLTNKQAADNANNQAQSLAGQAQQVYDTLAAQQEINLLSQSLPGSSTAASATTVQPITSAPLGVGTVTTPGVTAGTTGTSTAGGGTAAAGSNNPTPSISLEYQPITTATATGA